MNVSASPRSRERIREMAKWVREQIDWSFLLSR